jgi:hypothetical protein
MSVSLKINEDQDELLLVTLEGDEAREDIVTDEDGEVSPVIVDPTADKPGYLIIPGNLEGWKSYGVYKLVLVDTVVELNADLDEDDDEDDDDTDDGSVPV